nr:hypothetical protein [Georgfuchsia toluolica]
MNLLNAPGFAAHQQPLVGQMLGNFLAAHHAPLMAEQIEVIGHAHDACFGFVDFQPLLLAATTAGYISSYCLVAKGRAGTIEESLPGVFLHGAGGVLGILLRLMLIE